MKCLVFNIILIIAHSCSRHDGRSAAGDRGSQQLWTLGRRSPDLQAPVCKGNLTSLFERRSRFTFLERNPSRHSAGVMAGIDRHLHAPPLPSGAVSPSIEGQILPPLRHCKTSSALPVISARRQRPGKKAAWKIARDGYGASYPPTPTLRCCQTRKSRPSPIASTAHRASAWAIAPRTRSWESKSPSSRPDNLPSGGGLAPPRMKCSHLMDVVLQIETAAPDRNPRASLARLGGMVLLGNWRAFAG